MRTRIYTLRYSATLGGFDDTQLQNLQRDTELLSVETRFFSVGGIPHIALIVCWQEAPLRGEIEAAGKAIAASIPAVQPYAAEAARHDDLLGGIEERDRKLYETLRRWRGELARREGIPPYLILSNKEMLLVVLKKPTSSNALMGIPGIGKGKVQRHGEKLLRALNGAMEATEASSGTEVEAHRPAAPVAADLADSAPVGVSS